MAVAGGGALVPLINRLRKQLSFDVVAYSQDWHPQQHCSFYETFRELRPSARPAQLHASLSAEEAARAEASGPFAPVVLTDPLGAPMEQMLWPRHCVQVQTLIELDELLMRPDELLMRCW